MNNRRRQRGDDGAMLVLALIVITTVAVVTGVVLSHGRTNLTATVKLRGVSATSYTADTAAKLALDNLRQGAQLNPAAVGTTYPNSLWVYNNDVDGTGCFGLASNVPNNGNNLLLSNIAPKAGDQTADSSGRVECTPVPGAGLFGGGSGVEVNDANRFTRAITTFTGDLEVEDNSTVQVRGGVASNADIKADSSANTGLTTDGYAWANGSCIGRITSTPACDAGHAKVSDPSIPEPYGNLTGLRYQSAAAQDCGNFQPGYYNDAAALTAKTSSCAESIFSQGDYYFDFWDEDRDGSPNQWDITRTVIGGEMIGSGDPPGRCRSPIDFPDADGVRFVFGGTSRMNIGKDAKVELCGTSSTTSTPIVVQQLTSGTPAGSSTASFTSASAPATNGTSNQVSWTGQTVSNLKAPDSNNQNNAAAVWKNTSNNSRVGVLSLSNFTSSTAVPGGSLLNRATLKVRHKEWGANNMTLTTEMTVAGTTSAVALPVSAVSGETSNYAMPTSAPATVDVTPLLEDAVSAGGLSATSPSVKFTFQGASRGIAIDSVELVLDFTPPSLRAAPSSPQVKVINGFGNGFKGDFILQGALYAPRADIDVNFGNNVGTIVAFRWGLAVGQLELRAQPQVTYGYPLVSIPDKGTGVGKRVTIVDLKVFVCSQASSCSSGGRHSLTVRALIIDPPYATSGTYKGRPEPGKRQIRVLNWTTQV